MMYRSDMPRYMNEKQMHISGALLRMLWPRMPKDDRGVFDREVVGIAQKNDGTWWMHCYSRSSIVFWASGWRSIPKSVGERVQKIWQCAKEVK